MTSPKPPSRLQHSETSVAAWVGLVIAILGALLIILVQTATPQPAPANAPVADFSAARAMLDVRRIATTPHALGTPANAAVTAYLVQRLKAMGFETQVQRASSVRGIANQITGGIVENVIGVMPGRDRNAPALAIQAHYDTVLGSPGASDDTAGVAAALEIVRAIKAKGVPLRDVILVLTDGEEPGMLGARSFYGKSPLAARIGYVINMDTRGGGGRAAMFETGDNNGEDIRLYRQTASMPSSNSLTVFAYKQMANDSDLSVAKMYGKVGLNYAFIGRQFDYHSPSSTPEALDVGSLQHLGGQVLPTASALAFGLLPERAPDFVYGNLLGNTLIAYPMWFGWVVLLVAVLLIGISVTRARRHGLIVRPDILRGAGSAVCLAATSWVILTAVRRATGVSSDWMLYRSILARFTIFEVMMFLAGLGAILLVAAAASDGRRGRWIVASVALLFGVLSAIFGDMDILTVVLPIVAVATALITFGAPQGIVGGWLGMLGVGVVLAGVAQVLAPTAAYVIAWPLVLAALVAALTAAAGDLAGSRRRAALAIAVLGAVGGLAWLGTLFHSLLQGLDAPVAVVLPVVLAGLVVWPLSFATHRIGRWAPAALCLVASCALAAWLNLSSPWSARHPQSVEPVYILHPESGRAWRGSLLPPTDHLVRELAGTRGTLSRLKLPYLKDEAFVASDAPVSTPPPVAHISSVGADLVNVSSGLHPKAVRLILTMQAATQITSATVNGLPVLLTPKFGRPAPYGLKANEQGVFVWYGPAPFSMQIRTANPQSLKVEIAEIYDTWIGGSPAPRLAPEEQGWHMAGGSIVLGKAVHDPTLR